MNSITKWLTDPDAANYPFPYQISDRLKSPTKNIQGTVKNAFLLIKLDHEEKQNSIFIEDDYAERQIAM